MFTLITTRQIVWDFLHCNIIVFFFFFILSTFYSLEESHYAQLTLKEKVIRFNSSRAEHLHELKFACMCDIILSPHVLIFNLYQYGNLNTYFILCFISQYCFICLLNCAFSAYWEFFQLLPASIRPTYVNAFLFLFCSVLLLTTSFLVLKDVSSSCCIISASALDTFIFTNAQVSFNCRIILETKFGCYS